MTTLAYAVAALALVTAAGVVFSGRTIYSALSLVGNMICLATLFLLLNAQFVAAVQIIIYAGAVMVLFVFIIALLDPGHEGDERPQRDPRLLLGMLAAAYITVQVVARAASSYSRSSGVLRGQSLAMAANPSDHHSFAFSVPAVNAAGNVQVLGHELFTTFLLPFEITSLLLFVAAIGAVHLTRRTPQAPPARTSPSASVPVESAGPERKPVGVGGS